MIYQTYGIRIAAVTLSLSGLMFMASPLAAEEKKSQMLGSTPKPTLEDIQELNQFIEGVIDPKITLDLVEGRTRIILLKETPTQIQVANDGIMGHNLLTPKQLIVIGRAAGTTVMTLWFPDPKDKTKEKILSYLVRVVPDPEAKDRLKKIDQAREAEIRRVFPDSRIKLHRVGDKVVVTGQTKDAEQAAKVLRLIRGN
ncbi:MAG: pilus assembly protein N-terminal domain-containing protein [Planctomycetes bacterium]|nr:pilus assembly protein N-terminal domain-containing protein [Planctomycetota bacterium]